MERVDTLNSWQNHWERLQRHLPLTIILCYLSVLCEGPPLALGKICWCAVYHRFEHCITHWKVSEGHHITYLICISNAWVLVTKSDKIDQSEGIPDPSIREWPFVEFAHRHSFASSHCAFFNFLWKNKNVIYHLQISALVLEIFKAVFLWGDLDQDQWSKICLNHGASKEPANPLWSWIHRLLWCTMIQTDLGSLILIQITSKECTLSLKNV